jgi:hypothetical protein
MDPGIGSLAPLVAILVLFWLICFLANVFR